VTAVAFLQKSGLARGRAFLPKVGAGRGINRSCHRMDV
jgi:hypothetical protein